jgi:4-hydroxybenzoate polyprenyltransferase
MLFNTFLLAVAAALLNYGYSRIFNNSVELSRLTAAISFFATYSAYALMRSRLYVHEGQQKTIFHTNKAYRYSVLGSIGLSGLVLLYLLLQVGSAQWIIVSILGVASLIYFLPSLPKQGKFVRLRDIPYLKSAWVGFTWAGSCVVLAGASFPIEQRFPYVLEMFLFVTALALVYDIRDMKMDTMENHLTVALKLGIDRTRQLSLALILCDMVWLMFMKPVLPVFIMAMATNIFTLLLISRINERSGEGLFNHGIDGSLLLRGVLLLSIQYLLA